ncbi:protein kinase domain-containing protein [Gordonia sp. (in: high G+C Gram-positive bacteria)]|uniref:protein kinase domain-containing protein n=1 Tax=Gordonia sp. (in: high G+C Gram-positive bacteria) TaxID=84139 RepID=UPI0039E6D71D
MAMEPGDVFAGYRIIEVLGSGGMGTVYRVSHPRLQRDEALKTVKPASGIGDTDERFRREARAAAGLTHPGIVTIHEFDVTDDTPWYTMEYLDGEDLAKVAGRLPAHEVAEIIGRVGPALDYAHSREVIHRDVKPANIILTRKADGTLDRVVLVDFGIVKDVAAPTQLTQPFTPLGSPPYMAPEVIRAEPATAASDQYALAVSAFQALTGHTPYTGSTGELLAAHTTEPPPSITRHRPDLAAADPVLAKALSKDPAQRYGSCGEFADALGYALAGGSQETLIPAIADRTTAPLAERAPKTRRKLLYAALAALVFIAAGTTGGILWHHSQQHKIQRADWHLPNPPGVAQGSWTSISTASEYGLRTKGVTVCGIAAKRLYCWGTDNSRAQLGNGRTGGPTTTGLVAGQKKDTEIHALSVGADYSCAIVGPKRKVSCWGTGPLNLPDKEKKDNQGPVEGAVSISTSPYRACAVVNTGETQCWEDAGRTVSTFGDTYPVLGRATTMNGFPRATGVATSSQATCVVSEGSGTVACLGLTTTGAPIEDRNSHGVLSNQIAGPNDVKSLAPAEMGSTWCATTSTSVYCWGHGLYGLIGNGLSSLGPFSPTKVDALSNPTSISGAMGYYCATADGSAYCWGSDASDSGRLGLPAGQYYVPTKLPGLSKVTSITTGLNFACAIADGERYCWGEPPKA